MILFDEVIKEIENLIKDAKSYKGEEITSAPLGSKDQILFKNDTAYELGGGDKYGLGAELVTSSLIDHDEVVLLGKDLNELKDDTNYVKIALINVDENLYKNSDEAYASIRRLEYVKYHIYLDNLMIRISPLSKKECIRVGKKALKDQLSLINIGKSFIDQYKKERGVNFVKIVFIDSESFDYKHLEALINKTSNMVTALDHLAKKVNMDCSSCHLQTICEEVEKLSEK